MVSSGPVQLVEYHMVRALCRFESATFFTPHFLMILLGNAFVASFRLLVQCSDESITFYGHKLLGSSFTHKSLFKYLLILNLTDKIFMNSKK